MSQNSVRPSKAFKGRVRLTRRQVRFDNPLRIACDMMRTRCGFALWFIAIVFCCLPTAGSAQSNDDLLPTESDYYRLIELPTPEDVVLEAGGFQFLPNGDLAVCSRRGDIYLFHDPLSEDVDSITHTQYAQGLHEVLGLAYQEGSLFAMQRGELTKLTDEDQDGVADVFETVSDGWGINGDYHEYAFASKFDADGNIWAVFCLTGSFTSDSLYRGWCLRITPDGEVIPTCSGIRSPGGIGANAFGDFFYTDNQGPWNGTCSLKWLRPGSFQGHPIGNRWYEETSEIGERPSEPESGSRIMTEAAKIPELEPSAILFPYKKMGQSASGIACDLSGGDFGPFDGQLFVGDQTFSTVMRVDLELVQGHYQGACFPFREGFGSGSLALEFAPDGSLFVGGTNRGWGSRGSKPFAVERLVWTGEVPFEIYSMDALSDGFELEFTMPVDEETASDTSSYEMTTYTYIYQSSYGSPEVDHTEPEIVEAIVSDDRRSVRLKVDGLQLGHVHELHLDGIRNADGLPLLHSEAYYTLNYLPE